ncbi:MAG: hypothetical protein J6A79_19085 [Clostridia bacterium]|nr:hypothetical protein [Clostridia bacterium]
MQDFNYKIIKELGVLSEKGSGWSKQLNLVSWNDGEPKYDIRDWGPAREKMGKGISLNAAELQALIDILDTIDL